MTALSLSAEPTNARRVLTAEVFSPAILAYAVSMVRDAAARGVRRIYFLARDGYTLKRAAEQVCAVCGISMECRYLYCSRLSLRTAEYFLDEEASMKRLLNGCARLTENTLFSRIQLNEEERAAVLSDISREGSDTVLTRSDAEELCRKLRESVVFDSIMDIKSKKAFERTIDYFTAEGLFSEDTIYIADSGWCGSVQQSISTLIRAAGAKQQVFGYYFGLFAAPSEVRRNSRCFYFSPGKNVLRKAKFCNNLIEIALSAPHPMTVGYEYTEGGIEPVFSGNSAGEGEYALCEAISRDIEKYCRENAAELMKLPEGKLVKTAQKSIVPFMTNPTPQQAAAFSEVMFCDDSSDCYLLPVSEKVGAEEFFRQTLFCSAARRLLHRGMPAKSLIWFCGTAALSDVRFKRLLRADNTLRSCIRFLISR